MKGLQLLLLLSPLALSLACGGDPASSSNCEGAKCDALDRPDSEVPSSPCDGIMRDLSGRDNQKVAGRLSDPLAELIWKGESCPSSYQEIMARLREVDRVGCDTDERSGISTRVVSETAQATDSPTSYRLVTSRACNGRSEHEILFSLFGVRAGATSLPSNVEIIAFDETNGVFNYYETGPDEINFFGNSKDMKKGAQGNTRRCAACHTGGGLVMKELDTPWLHWEGHLQTPGAQELVEAHADLGRKSDGANFEGVVKRGNEAWNATRVTDLQDTGDLKALLEPLFCTVEVNIDNGADFKDSALSSIPFDSLLDPKLASFGSIPVSSSDYETLMAQNGQEVPGVGLSDTVFAYPYIERSHIDSNYVDALKAAGILDDELIKDVLMVDFTRPIFSDDRCALLDSAPLIGTLDASPEAIREGFLAELANAPENSPEAELRTNLQNTGGHDAAVQSFLGACRSLPGLDFLTNAMMISSANRERAGNMPVFEFPQTLPTDNQVIAPGARLDPISCELSTSFRPVATPAPLSLLSDWNIWVERNSAVLSSQSEDHQSVTIAGSGPGGFNGGVFQQVCGVAGKTVGIEATTSWNVSGGTRWTQIFVLRDGSIPQNGVDVLEGPNVRFSPEGSQIFTTPIGDCVTLLLKAGSINEGSQSATFSDIELSATDAAG